MELTLKQTMSDNIVSVMTDDRLTKAYQIMKENRIRHLTVLDRDARTVGIISDRDFQRAMLPVSNLDMDPQSFLQEPLFRRNSKVHEFMHRSIKTLEQNVGIGTAIRIMLAEKISAILITDHNAVVGVVTSEDFLRLLLSAHSEPDSMADKVLSSIYNSPLGKISEALAGIGI